MAAAISPGEASPGGFSVFRSSKLTKISGASGMVRIGRFGRNSVNSRDWSGYPSRP
jgi:hypothetical protein